MTPRQEWKRFYSLVRYCRRTHGYIETYFDNATINGVSLVCDTEEIYTDPDKLGQYEIVRRVSFFEMLDLARHACDLQTKRELLTIARRERESSACGFQLP